MLLNGKWNLKGPDAQGNMIDVEATVPGCVHTDFINAGILGDIYYRDNAETCKFIENNDYTYEKTFTVDKVYKNAYVEFDGLDTYCDVYLNNVKIGEGNNMFLEYAFCVDGIIKEGENTLTVKFRSPVLEVRTRAGELKACFTKERVFTRRIQCTYGWDWVGRFVTMGIYRDVRLTFRKANELENVYVYTKRITPFSAQINAEFTFRDVEPETEDVNIEIYSPDNKLIFGKKRKILKETMDESFDIVNPELWYPNGYGEQPLYTFVISTDNSRKELKFGIREITVIQIEDEEGSEEQLQCREMQKDEDFAWRDKNERTASFFVVVNDIKIFCRGANWVPCEPFPSAETKEKITKLLELAKDGKMNMIRVWGGGIFEQDHFYEECDRLGILVTQDFLMACAKYPDTEEWFIKALNDEAKTVALRLRNHPCLAWWTGDNENAEFGTENTTDFNGYRSATYGIEPVIKMYDKERKFFPSSPYGGEFYSSVTRGTTHNTNYQELVYARVKDTQFDYYTEYLSKGISRFSVEQCCYGEGFASSLKKFMTDEDIYGEDQTISEYHTKTGPIHFTLFQMANVMSEKIFGKFKDGYDRLRKIQMLQCEWIRLTFEAHRRNMWFNAGLVYWMLNDCWPASIGWSIIDYYALPKPGYYSFKRCAGSMVASIENKNGRLIAHISNDRFSPCEGKGSLYVYDFKKNEKVLDKSFDFSVSKATAEKVFECDYSEFEKLLTKDTIIVFDAESNLGKDRTFYVKDGLVSLDLSYEDAEIIAEDDDSITVKANQFLPYAIFDLPYLLEENAVTMLTSEVRKINKKK